MENKYISLLDIHFDNITTFIHDLDINDIEMETYSENHIQFIANSNLHELYCRLSRFFLTAEIVLHVEHEPTDLILRHRYINYTHNTVAVSYWQHQYETFGPFDTYQRLLELAPNIFSVNMQNNNAYQNLSPKQQQTLLSLTNHF